MASDTENKYLKLRHDIVDFIRTDLVGPASEDEVIEEPPVQRYSAGILFPQLKVESPESTAEREEELDQRIVNDEEIGVIEQSSSFYPSALGLSFIVADDVDKITAHVSAAKYSTIKAKDYGMIACPLSAAPEKHLENEHFSRYFEYADGLLRLKAPLIQDERSVIVSMCADDRELQNAVYWLFNLYANGWKRLPIEIDIPIDLSRPQTEYPVAEGENLRLVCIAKKLRDSNDRLCTLSLVNIGEAPQAQADNKLSYFQVGLKLAADRPVFQDMGKSTYKSSDREETALRLLYSKKRFYATGHGCSATWNIPSGNIKAREIASEVMPQYSVPQMNFDPFTDKNRPDLRMKTLALGGDKEIFASLDALAGAYEEWTTSLQQQLNQIEPDLKGVAEENIALCREAAERMRAGIDLLRSDSKAMRAFRLANEAMLMQRVHGRLQSRQQFPDEAPAMPENYADHAESEAAWRPFQTAFLLMSVGPAVSTSDKFRDVVDLIWFPTGGGKTEAYLGLTAFTIFLRRLRNAAEVSGGTTVLMRYTLRLLTSQQFQRACTLICACEKLRLQNSDLGSDQITIGLWLGSNSTPNTVKDAAAKIDDLYRLEDSSDRNPFQVLNCPWCGTFMARKNGKGMFCYRLQSRPNRITMFCANKQCDFKKELPIKVIDEDIYRDPPTLLFGTVDKFAMLPWKEDAASIFALDTGNQHLSPELIIQDELHLISGSLGTIVGLYETAIDLMCSAKGVKPKIVASTATIRRAQEQCLALYARPVRQFPSPGLEASDSFFAKEAPITLETPGRLYVGIMPSGKTSTTMQVRLNADVVQSVDILDADDQAKDKYWTQVIYCNSIRELGSSKSIILDDVKTYSRTVSRRNHARGRTYSDLGVEELTSRIPAERIPQILQRLNIEKPAKEAIDALLATNMISVGVDINRLGLMVILGQPKTTSEYIQASSRVGRSYPGVVLTLFSPVKSRDRSHYEQFIEYHQSLYRHVEPTSVTPFSASAREKAFPAVLMTVIRHLAGYHASKDLGEFDLSNEHLKTAVADILKRVSLIDESEESRTEAQINVILAKVDEMSRLESGISYGNPTKEKPALMQAPNARESAQFTVPQSMRSTDAECYVTLDHSYEDEK